MHWFSYTEFSGSAKLSMRDNMELSTKPASVGGREGVVGQECQPAAHRSHPRPECGAETEPGRSEVHATHQDKLLFVSWEVDLGECSDNRRLSVKVHNVTGPDCVIAH